MRLSVRSNQRPAFSLAELLVVIGVLSLLLAVLIPPLQLAKRQAMRAHCAASMQHVGMGLEQGRTEFGYYPLWDDGDTPIRHTWMDVLVQRELVSQQTGYCSADRRPDFLTEARGQAFGILYPADRSRYGVDYSYGISVPLSAAGWTNHPVGTDGRAKRRIIQDIDRDTSRRILASDAHWSAIYNLSGEAIRTRIWNQPSQFDNTIAYRHYGQSANLLIHDGHVTRAAYQVNTANPVDTIAQFVWQPGESIFATPDEIFGITWRATTDPPSTFPVELLPNYYTDNHLWTRIMHK